MFSFVYNWIQINLLALQMQKAMFWRKTRYAMKISLKAKKQVQIFSFAIEWWMQDEYLLKGLGLREQGNCSSILIRDFYIIYIRARIYNILISNNRKDIDIKTFINIYINFKAYLLDTSPFTLEMCARLRIKDIFPVVLNPI